MDLARAVTLGSKSRRTHDHSLLSHLRRPQFGGISPRIHITHEQGGPVIPQGNGFSFRRLLQLAGHILTCLHTSFNNPAFDDSNMADPQHSDVEEIPILRNTET
jgi:hypothetical protein